MEELTNNRKRLEDKYNSLEKRRIALIDKLNLNPVAFMMWDIEELVEVMCAIKILQMYFGFNLETPAPDEIFTSSNITRRFDSLLKQWRPSNSSSNSERFAVMAEWNAIKKFTEEVYF